MTYKEINPNDMMDDPIIQKAPFAFYGNTNTGFNTREIKQTKDGNIVIQSNLGGFMKIPIIVAVIFIGIYLGVNIGNPIVKPMEVIIAVIISTFIPSTAIFMLVKSLIRPYTFDFESGYFQGKGKKTSIEIHQPGDMSQPADWIPLQDIYALRIVRTQGSETGPRSEELHGILQDGRVFLIIALIGRNHLKPFAILLGDKLGVDIGLCINIFSHHKFDFFRFIGYNTYIPFYFKNIFLWL